MAKMEISTKRIQIDKANFTIVIATAVAAFIFIFSLFACRALLMQRAYQSKVIGKKEVAKNQLADNIKAVSTLQRSYEQFVQSPENAIGGASDGAGDRDGDNAKIILDALPSQYDFPALTASLEKLIVERHATIQSIKGTDDEVNQQSSQADASNGPVEMPFEASVEANYATIKDLALVFERSIRPFNIRQMGLTANKDGEVVMDITAKTYYQPAKSLNVKSEVVQ